MNVDYELIGKRIKEARKKRAMTQERLAEELGVSIGYVSQLERGITKISLNTLAAISGILNCDMGELVTGSSVRRNDYLGDELSERIELLDNRERKLLLDLINSILRNR